MKRKTYAEKAQRKKRNANRKAQLKQKSMTTQTKKHNSNKEAQLKQRSTTQTETHNSNKEAQRKQDSCRSHKRRVSTKPSHPGTSYAQGLKTPVFLRLWFFFRKQNTISFWEVASCFVALCFFTCVVLFKFVCALRCVLRAWILRFKAYVRFLSLIVFFFNATCLYFGCVFLFVLAYWATVSRKPTALMRVKDPQKRERVALKKTFHHTFGAC